MLRRFNIFEINDTGAVGIVVKNPRISTSEFDCENPLLSHHS